MLFNKNSRIGLRALFFMFLAIALMIVDSHSNLLKKFRHTVSMIVTPVEYIVSAPIDWTNDLLNALSTQKNLLSENAKLKTQNTLLKAKLQQQYAIESENKMLKALLQSSEQAGGHVSVAQILSISLNPAVPEIVINKGSKDDVFEGQAVLDSQGVMGQIIHVESTTSHVMLITNPKSAIPIQNTRNNIRSILIGNGTNNLLQLQYVTSTTDIKSGDKLITSGLGGKFPFGYTAGTVVSVKTNPNDRFIDVTVKPAAWLNRSRLVLLVWK